MVNQFQNIITRVYAADIGLQFPAGISDKCNTGYDYTWTNYVQCGYRFALFLGTWVAIAMIIYASYKILFSQGDSGKAKEGKDIIVGTVLGYILLWLVGIILNFLGLPNYN